MNNTYADFLTGDEVPVYRPGAKWLVRRDAGARGLMDYETFEYKGYTLELRPPIATASGITLVMLTIAGCAIRVPAAISVASMPARQPCVYAKSSMRVA